MKSKRSHLDAFVWLVMLCCGIPSALSFDRAHHEIFCFDQETGEGIPMVELETVHGLRFVTDNTGHIALDEPNLLQREVFFYVKSHGYSIDKDGLGFEGRRLKTNVGGRSTLALTRNNFAERLARLTGEGRYRDTLILGREIPHPSAGLEPTIGQDSIQAAIYRGYVFWMWGDTSRLEYPLGIFRVSGAKTPIDLIKDSSWNLRLGIPYDYFTDRVSHSVRNMVPIPDRPEGVVWLDGLLQVESDGNEKLIGHYSRRKGLTEEIEHGIALFDDTKEIFEPLVSLDRTNTWRFPHGHPIRYEEDGTLWFLFGNPVPNVRVKASLASLLDPTQYESWIRSQHPLKENRSTSLQQREVNDREGFMGQWQKDLPPESSKTEYESIQKGGLDPKQAYWNPENVDDPSERVLLHSGTVRWNDYRKKWILVAGQLYGKSSMLGETWYSESSKPMGPFLKAKRLLSHDRKSFYNVCHHAFLDREQGKIIHFEGTYTHDFSGNPDRTPRYNYNQILYRVDLSRSAIQDPFQE